MIVHGFGGGIGVVSGQELKNIVDAATNKIAKNIFFIILKRLPYTIARFL